MIEEANIDFKLANDTWQWYVQKGKYQMRGQASTLEKAELMAYEVVEQLPEVSAVHAKYSPGKPVKPVQK